VNVPISKPYLDGAEERSVIETLRSGWISQGRKCARLETMLASFLGVKRGCAVNSGTSALELTLRALEIGEGDEVLVPAFTCAATLHPIEHVGATPVPVDIDLTTFAVDASLLSAARSARTRALIVVHPFGCMADMPSIVEFAAKNHVLVVEDVALGLGASVDGRQAGSFGIAGCLSFHPRKMVTTGEGGMVVTDSDDLAKAIDRLRNYGASDSALARHEGNVFSLPTHDYAGFNYKLSDVHASIGLAQMHKLPTMIRARQAIARRYSEAFADIGWLRLPAEATAGEHVYQSFVCTLLPPDDEEVMRVRQRLFTHLSERGVAAVPAAQNMATVNYYRHKYGWRPENYGAALIADRATVALPMYPGLSPEEHDHVVRAVRDFRP